MSTINVERELSRSNELPDDDLDQVVGGSGIVWTYTKQKSDGTGGGNVAAKWN